MADWFKSMGNAVSYFFSGETSNAKKVEVPQKPKEDESEENDFGFEHLDLEERIQKRKEEEERKIREAQSREELKRRMSQMRFEFRQKFVDNN